MKQIRFYQIITAISCLFLISCGIEQNLKKADKYLSLGEYYDAATQYKKCTPRLLPKSGQPEARWL